MQQLPLFKVKGLAALFSVAAILMSVPGLAFAAPVKLGIYVASQGQVGAPEDAHVLDSYAELVGRKPDIVMNYSNITEPLLTPTGIANLQARDETPMVTWQLYKSGWSGPTVSLQEVAVGDYDTYLRKAADLAKSLPFEVMIRFAHEMNGDWYSWSGDPSAYVEAWRHVVTLFRQEGANNVKWVWAPNVDNGRYPFAAYFPGDAWVDYVALDGYNWGTAGSGNRWQSLYEVFASSYGEITQLSASPVIISETASGEIGGDKAAWIREGFLTTIPQDFPRVAAVIWFDRDQEQDWRINSSLASLNAYREVVASSMYGGPNPTSGAPNPSFGGPSPSFGGPSPSFGGPNPNPGGPKPATPSAATPAATQVITLEVTPSRTVVVSRAAKRWKTTASRSRLFYRLSRRAVLQITLRALGRRAHRSFSLTIRHATRMGYIPMSLVTGMNQLPRGAYLLTATAVDRGGAVSKARHARFRVVGGRRRCRRWRCVATRP